MSTEAHDETITTLVEAIQTEDQAHQVFEALAGKFDFMVSVRPMSTVVGVPLTVQDAEEALQEVVDNHPDASFREAIHQLWVGVNEGFLDSPAITEHDGSLVAPGYDSVKDLATDYVALLTTGPWQPLLGVTAQNGTAFGYAYGEYDSLVGAWKATKDLVGQSAWEVLDRDTLLSTLDENTPAVVESYNLFRIDPRTGTPAFRVVP